MAPSWVILAECPARDYRVFIFGSRLLSSGTAVARDSPVWSHWRRRAAIKPVQCLSIIMDQGYLALPTFDYSSAFNYRSCLSEDFDSHLDQDHFDSDVDKRLSNNPAQTLAYYLLTTLSFIFFVVTVPISSFFCVKVCLIYIVC